MRTYSSIIFAIINTVTTVVATKCILLSAHQKMIDDEHQAAGSICEAYEVSDIYLCDTHQRLCITEAPDGVYIPPMLEIELHR